MTQQFSAKHWAEKARKQATGTPAECPAGSAQVWAVGTIDQCPDGSAKHWADDARQTAQNIGNPANRDLSNLTDEGLSRLSNLPLFIAFKTGHVLNNVSYVNGRLFSWLAGAVYVSAYQELIKEMTGSPTGQITTQTLYAYQYFSTIFYTKVETLSAGLEAYDETGTQIGTVQPDENAFYFQPLSGVPDKGSTAERMSGQDIVQTSGVTAEQKTQTIAGITVRYYLTPTKKKVCLADQADNIAALYLATGAADFYLLDVANTQFKLPRRHTRRLLRAYKEGDLWYNLYSDGWCEQGGFDSVKDQNIHTISLQVPYQSGDYSVLTSYNTSGSSLSNGAIIVYSRSSDKFLLRKWSSEECSWTSYGYADTSLIQDEFEYEYYFVGNSVQNQTALDVGALTQTVNNKADVDLSNLTPTNAFKSQSVSWTMPNLGIRNALTFNTIYQAATNGWVVMYAEPGWDGNAYITVSQKSDMSDSLHMFVTGGGYYDSENERGGGTVPIARGNYYKVQGNGFRWAYFLPCQEG